MNNYKRMGHIVHKPDLTFSFQCYAVVIAQPKHRTATINMRHNMQILVAANTSNLRCHVCQTIIKFDIVHSIK